MGNLAFTQTLPLDACRLIYLPSKFPSHLNGKCLLFSRKSKVYFFILIYQCHDISHNFETSKIETPG